MKRATVVVFLLFTFIVKSYFLGEASAAHNPPVLDSDGDELRAGVEYYVISGIWGAGGGGLALGRTKNQSCPEIVVQRQFDRDYGIPVIFSNSDISDDVIRLSTDINIEFVPIRDRLCLTSTVWRLDNYDPSTGQWWVTTDGVRGNPGPSTLSSWFKIAKAGVLGYKFTFCPSICESCVTLCNDITRFGDDGQIRLALTNDNGWPFWFKKARSTIKQVGNAQH